MVKGSHILMDQDREQLIQIVTSTQLVNTDVYNEVKQQNPMLAKFMLDKFKALLNNSDITDIERQTLFIRFLETQQDYSVIKDILSYIDTCELKLDYSAIIMEWTYHNTDLIIQNNLKSVDAVGLCEKRNPQKSPLIEVVDVEVEDNVLTQFIDKLLAELGDEIQDDEDSD